MVTWTVDDRESTLWGSVTPALLRARRISLGLRTRDVARQLGVPPAALRGLERGAPVDRGFLYQWRTALFRAAEEPQPRRDWIALSAFVVGTLAVVVAAVMFAGGA